MCLEKRLVILMVLFCPQGEAIYQKEGGQGGSTKEGHGHIFLIIKARPRQPPLPAGLQKRVRAH